MGTDGLARDLAPDQSVHVVAASGRRPCLLAFGGLQGRLGMPVFEFMNLTAGRDVHRVFVRHLHQAWYQRGARGLGRSRTAREGRGLVGDSAPRCPHRRGKGRFLRAA